MVKANIHILYCFYIVGSKKKDSRINWVSKLIKVLLLKVEVREVGHNVLLLVICICPAGLLHNLGALLGRDRLNPPVSLIMQYVSQHLSYIVMHKQAVEISNYFIHLIR